MGRPHRHACRAPPKYTPRTGKKPGAFDPHPMRNFADATASRFVSLATVAKSGGGTAVYRAAFDGAHALRHPGRPAVRDRPRAVA